MWVQSLGREDPQEESMAIHFVFLAGESHGQRTLEGLQSRGCTELDTTEVAQRAHAAYSLLQRQMNKEQKQQNETICKKHNT